MKFYLLILFLCLSAFSYAQAIPEQEDIKVGLVLSGGGAKGLAHVGALKVIEESGVRIDYIAGTSMGAIIGGLYAAGYSVEQLEEIIRSVDFDKIIQDDLPRRAKTFYEKEDSEKYAITLPFDNFKIALPQSLSLGQNSYNLLARTLDEVGNIERFEDLPIPFFCVATDVERGEQVILDRGYLPEMISASGALPSLFSPVEVNGKLLIDGGVVNNYPVDELRAKGMDIIIGVDVQDGLRDRNELLSAPDLLLQINNFRTIKAMDEKREKTDVYIQPDIMKYTLVSFDQKEEIMEEGRLKALQQKEALEEIAMRQSTLSRKHTFPKPKPQDSIAISAVAITGNENYTRAYILGKLKLKPPVKLAYSDFTDGINNLTATGNFRRIGYRFSQAGEGKLLQLNLQESESRQSIRLGLHYDDLYRTAALVNYTRKRVLFNNDITSFDFIVGDNLRYAFDYYIDKGFYWSVGFRSTYNTFDKGVSARIIESLSGTDLSGLSRLGLEYQDLTNQLFLQTLFMKQFSLDLGVQHKFIDLETQTVEDDDEDQPGFVFERSNLFGAFGKLRFDTLDNRFFPNTGVYFEGDFNAYLYSSNFNGNFTEFGIANAEFLYAFSVTPDFSITTDLGGGFKVGGSEVRSLDFALGGYGNKKINNLVPFYGYDFLSVVGDGYVKAGIQLDFKPFDKNHIVLGANYANIGNELFSTDEFLPPPDYSGYAIGYGLETILGPVEVKYTFSPEIDEGEWFIRVGFSF